MAQLTVKHRFIHQAPRKLRRISDVLRGLPVSQAIVEAQALPHVAGRAIANLLKSATAAAKDHGLRSNQLFITRITVDEGPKLRRFIPMSRGRSQRIEKQMSHLTVAVSDEAVKMASSMAYKKELSKPIKKSQGPSSDTQTTPKEEVPVTEEKHDV